jgi:hypothetical protein
MKMLKKSFPTEIPVDPKLGFPLSKEEIVKTIFTAAFTDLLQRLNSRIVLWGVILSYVTGGIAAFALEQTVRGWVLCSTALVATVLADAVAGNEAIITQLKRWFLWIEKCFSIFGLESLSGTYQNYRSIGSQTKAMRAAIWRSTAAFCLAGSVTLYNTNVQHWLVALVVLVDLASLYYIRFVSLGKKNLPHLKVEDILEEEVMDPGIKIAVPALYYYSLSPDKREKYLPMSI